jgi:hypothetical protein
VELGRLFCASAFHYTYVRIKQLKKWPRRSFVLPFYQQLAALRVKNILLLSAGLLGLASCDKKTGEVVPTHKVSVAIQAKNSSSDYEGRMLVLKEAGQTQTTVYSKSLRSGIETFDHSEKPVPAGTTYTAEVQFYPLGARAGSAPSGSIQATIKVDGVVRNTVTISGITPPNSAGLRIATISTTL